MGGQSRHRMDGKGKPRREIVAAASNQPYAGSIPPRQDAKAIMLDFVNPAGAGWRGLRRRGQTRLDDPQAGAGTLTQRHGRLL